jgi:hypothetical protein
MKNVIVAHSSECHKYLESKGIETLLHVETVKDYANDGYKLSKGYDWQVYEFNTNIERDAFVLGLNAQSGWINEPFYQYC